MVPDVPPWVAEVVSGGSQAPSADNSQPWRFVWDGRTLALRLDSQRAQAGLGADHLATLLAMGAAVENVVQAAGAVGLPAEALKLGDGEGSSPFAAIQWSGSVRPPTAGTQPALYRRHTNRGPYETAALEPALRARIAAVTEADARVVVVSGPPEKGHLAQLVRRAAEVRFQTEEIHRWLGSSLRFTAVEVERGDGLDVASLLLPPGTTALLKFSLDWRRMQMLNRFGGYRLFAAVEAAMLGQCAALVAIVGPTRHRADALAAGRLLERVWIELNEAGLAAHPYYVLPDQLYRLRAGRVAAEFRRRVEVIAADVADFLRSPDETIFMVLRVGWPKVYNPPRSRRLPTQGTFTVLRS